MAVLTVARTTFHPDLPGDVFRGYVSSRITFLTFASLPCVFRLFEGKRYIIRIIQRIEIFALSFSTLDLCASIWSFMIHQREKRVTMTASVSTGMPLNGYD